MKNAYSSKYIDDIDRRNDMRYTKNIMSHSYSLDDSNIAYQNIIESFDFILSQYQNLENV